MRGCAYLLLTVAVVAVSAAPSEAQLFGSKKNKTPPQQRVPELLVIVQQDKDSHKRSDAAEELRQYDPNQFPEIVPVLIGVLQNDASTSVRIEAATSLGRIRPISVPAGQALEKASSSDSNLRVRLQAHTSLAYYQLSGYHAPKNKEVATAPATGPALKGPTTAEPPLATGPAEDGAKGSKMPTTSNSSPGARPLPSGPPLPGSQVPMVTVPSTTPVPAEGPTLTPPRPF